MKFNYGYERWLFEQKQEKQRREYLAAGMSEADVQKMYEFDLEYFRLLRCEALHAVNPQEMMGFDPETGDYHYMDMDELPEQQPLITSVNRYGWIDEIEDAALSQALSTLKPDYIEICTLLIEGCNHTDIAVLRGVTPDSINKKIARIKKVVKTFK